MARCWAALWLMSRPKAERLDDGAGSAAGGGALLALRPNEPKPPRCDDGAGAGAASDAVSRLAPRPNEPKPPRCDDGAGAGAASGAVSRLAPRPNEPGALRGEDGLLFAVLDRCEENPLLYDDVPECEVSRASAGRWPASDSSTARTTAK
ncbi:hypothetical protein CSQ96_01365 [Janthinobacterium sp. BJB412]|nr:hypothetical protein CSQ96_01365 [Janthinobacterium sp. BJB412]